MIKIKILKQFNFFKLNYQLKLYLDQITGQSSYSHSKKIMIIFLAIFFTTLAILLKFPLNDFQRLLLSDPCLFYNLPAKLNWIFMLFCTDSFFFCYCMYLPANKAMCLVKEILYSQNTVQTNAFFAYATIRKNGVVKTTLEVVRQYTKLFLFLSNYFVLLVGKLPKTIFF